ncbi:hypothetical protein GIB67_015429 [Kingdonia uniflora]|uniref:Uncharacterized protein n=1 Tax=Kingdonia uniflora TaxID=39325 RepID=A0A7J7KYY4_9MAGN|nr:hypothetical protein GIB67_015429 [Kingdonia uniflora]
MSYEEEEEVEVGRVGNVGEDGDRGRRTRVREVVKGQATRARLWEISRRMSKLGLVPLRRLMKDVLNFWDIALSWMNENFYEMMRVIEGLNRDLVCEGWHVNEWVNVVSFYSRKGTWKVGTYHIQCNPEKPWLFDLCFTGHGWDNTRPKRVNIDTFGDAITTGQDAAAFWDQQPLATREYASSTVIPACKVVADLSNNAKDLKEKEVSAFYRSPDNSLCMLPSTSQISIEAINRSLLENMGANGSTGTEALGTAERNAALFTARAGARDPSAVPSICRVSAALQLHAGKHELIDLLKMNQKSWRRIWTMIQLHWNMEKMEMVM